MTRLGLELCPAEVGPHLRLKYPGNEWMLIAMKQILDRYGNPSVLNLNSEGSQLKLNGDYAKPSRRWHQGSKFIFLPRPSTKLRASLSSPEATDGQSKPA